VIERGLDDTITGKITELKIGVKTATEYQGQIHAQYKIQWRRKMK
jgi:hypothetical protein